MNLLIVIAFLLTTHLVLSSSTEENSNAVHRHRSRSPPRNREHQARPDRLSSNHATREDLSNGHLHPPPTAPPRNLRIEVPSPPVNLPDIPPALGRHHNQSQE